MQANSAGWDALAWAAAFAEGRAQPQHLLEYCLARIDRYDASFGICNHVDERRNLLDQAAASQVRWQHKAPLSPLDGTPFGVKANIAVRGFPWHGGIEAFRARRADADADCVTRLRGAGMIPVAVFNMHEAALGTTTDNPAFTTTRNPHDPSRIPGGSSGGSAAAVAAGFVPIALGTDDLGSVRLPSALCGVVGYKPGRDEISTNGVMPLCRSLDHVGIHARSVRDLAAVMQAVGQDSAAADAIGLARLSRQPSAANAEAFGLGSARGRLSQKNNVLAAPAAGKRQGVSRLGDRVGEIARLARWIVAPDASASEAVLAAFDTVLATLGLSQSVDWTDIDLAAVRRAGLLACERDGAKLYSSALREQPDGFSPAFRRLVAWGAAQPAEKITRAQNLVATASDRLRMDLDGRLLLSPTTLYLAPLRNEPTPTRLADLTAPAAIAGVPAISVPMGEGGHDLPMGLQILGRKGIDVLRAAHRIFPGTSRPAIGATL